MIDSLNAVQTAKDYVRKVFADEHISRPRLEELTFDREREEWRITVGFSYTFDRGESASPRATSLAREVYGNRAYKVVRIDDRDGEVVAMTDRLLDPIQ